MSKSIKVNSSQSVRLPYMEHLTVLIPSTSQPSWGGYSIFDLKEKGCSIHEITIKLNISPITGLTGTQANYPNYNPAFFFLQRLEIVINNNIIDTIYIIMIKLLLLIIIIPSIFVCEACRFLSFRF